MQLFFVNGGYVMDNGNTSIVYLPQRVFMIGGFIATCIIQNSIAGKTS